MEIQLVTYVYDQTRSAELDEKRPLHRAFLAQLQSQGIILASGPVTDGAFSALLALKAETPEEALAQVESDPFFQAGLVLERRACTWNVVIGQVG